MKSRFYKLLRQSERYTRTDMAYLTKGGFWLGLNALIASLTAFLLSVAYANLIPKEVFGTYKFVLSIAAIIEAFALTGIGTAVTRAASHGNDTALREGVRAYLKWSIGILVLALGAALYYFIQGNQELATAFLIVGAFTPLVNSFSLYGAFIIGKERFDINTAFSLIRNAVPAVLMVTVMLFSDSMLLLLATYLASNTAVAGILYLETKRRLVKNDRADEKEETLRYGKHLSVMNILGTLSFQIDRILLFHFLGAAQLAVYSFALALPQQVRQVNKIITPMLLPRFSKRPIGDIQKNIFHKALLLFAASAVLTILYILIAPFIFRIFFPAYTDAVVFSQIFALILLTTPAVLYKQALVAHARTRELYIIQTTMPIFKIALLAVFVPLYGIIGALTVILTSEIFNFYLSAFLFNRISDRHSHQ